MGYNYIDIKLNFEPDKVTHTGKLYPKEIFIDAVDKRLKTGLYIIRLSGFYSERVIGKVIGYNEDNNTFKVAVEKDVDVKKKFISTHGEGEIEEVAGIKIVKKFELDYMFLTTE